MTKNEYVDMSSSDYKAAVERTYASCAMLQGEHAAIRNFLVAIHKNMQMIQPREIAAVLDIPYPTIPPGELRGDRSAKRKLIADADVLINELLCLKRFATSKEIKDITYIFDGELVVLDRLKLIDMERRLGDCERVIFAEKEG